MQHRLSFLLLIPLLWLATACSDGRSNPLDPSPDPNPGPSPSGTELTIDFSEFAGGDTVTSTHGVQLSLLAKGEGCADVAIAFDSSSPHGISNDDLDLGTPNQAFGGPGVGEGGGEGRFQNNRPLGNLLVIQEDPALDDANPDPQDDCDTGGTLAFDFRGLSAAGVTLSAITVVDVDNKKQGASEFRLYGEGDAILEIVNPPVTRPNGVATIDFGNMSGVERMELEERISIAIARIVIMVPDSAAEAAG